MMMVGEGDSLSLTRRCTDLKRKNTSSSHHGVRNTSSRPTRRTSKSSTHVFVAHQHLFVITLLQLLSITAALIYLEDPHQAVIYDSLPNPPEKDTISNVFLSNLTEGGLDNVPFKVGTPLHYLVVQSSIIEEPDVEVTIESDEFPDEELIDGGDTSLQLFTNGTNSTNATTILMYQNETDTLTNYTDVNGTTTLIQNETDVMTNNTDTNETISSSPANITNSTTIFDRRTPSSLLPSWDETPVSSPIPSGLSVSSSSIPTREISGEYTNIVHHNPFANNLNADVFITGSGDKTLSITELLGFFNDSKLVFATDEEYVFFDSRQARFGSDLGPKGNAAFVNIMLPPRLEESELTADLGEMGEKGAVGSPQDDELTRMREMEGLDQLMGLYDENQTNVTANADVEDYLSNQTQTNATEDNQSVDNVTSDTLSALVNETMNATEGEQSADNVNVTIDTSTALVNETMNATQSVNDEEYSGQFDTHISSYFCLDDFVRWRSTLSGASVSPSGAMPSLNNDAIHSTRGIALLVQRGRCSFEDKAKTAMVINDMLASENKMSRIDHIIVYNNGTIDNINNNVNETSGEEGLIEMLQVQNNNAVNVGMLYVTTASGLDLLSRILGRQNELGISPHLDVSWIQGRHLINESTEDDRHHGDTVIEDSIKVLNDTITNGWFFPATLTRFCLSCGKETDYGFYPFLPVVHRPGQFGPTNWPNVFSDDDYYQPQGWVEMVRRLMVAVLVILLVGPVVLATHRWHTVGGTIRLTTDENGRRRVRIISPTLEVFVEGVPDTVETNGTKLDRAQVFSLPEIVFRPPSAASDRNEILNNVAESPLMLTTVGEGEDAENGASPDPSQGSDDSHDNILSSTAQLTPPGSEENEMFASSACCPICIEEFEPGETLRVLPRCKHLFHIDCILPWLTERQGCCPQCRTPVLPDEFQRSRGSTPRRSSSVLDRFRRERRQEREESDSALTPTILFTEIEDDLGGDGAAADTVPRESRGNIVPYGIEETESRPFDTNNSSPDMMEQGLESGEVPPGYHVSIAATVSADDIEINMRAPSLGEDEGISDPSATGMTERSVTTRDAHAEVDSNDSDDDGYTAFLKFLKTPTIVSHRTERPEVERSDD